MKVIDALKRIERTGAENSRVTKKLKESVRTLADVIGKSFEVEPDGYLKINERYSIYGRSVSCPIYHCTGGEIDLLGWANGEVLWDKRLEEFIGGNHSRGELHPTRKACLDFSAAVADGLLDEIAEALESQKIRTDKAITKLEKAS